MVAFATQVKRRRGTAAQNNEFTGAEGEIVVNLTDKSLRVHDGQTKGGFETLRQNMQNSVNITNCITEIPQDIKLELNGGTLTLKAGSKVYVPNGAGNFDVRIIANDMSTTFSTNGTYLVGFAFSFGNITAYLSTVSGGTEPTTLTNGLTWYDTTNNVIKRAWAGSWQNSLFSFPFAIITVSGGAISSIDQIFNGFGYIGSTVFALPGVKGLIPNGRNEDGTLKNRVFQSTKVTTTTATGAGTKTLTMTAGGVVDKPGGFRYDPENNYNYNYDSRTTQCNCGTFIAGASPDYKITSFEPKTAFHAVDYSDFESTVEEINSSITAELANKANTSASNFTAAGKGTIVNLTVPNYSAGVAFTLNASTPYTAPKDGVVFIHTGRAHDQRSNIKIAGTAVADTISNWSNIPYFFPVAKGTVVSTDYDTIGTAIFYPLKGAN